MTVVLIDKATRTVQASGAVLTAPDDAHAVVPITDAQAAKLGERGVKTLGENNQISVYLDPAIVAAETAATQAEATRQAELTQDRGDLPALLAALVANRDALLDTGQAFSIAQLRPIIARTITLELLIVRHLRRGGL